MDGILLINKPIGLTSRDVVNKLVRKFSNKKIGHTGTLDPFASGLLIVTMNRGTKITPFIEELRKQYIAEITLGKKTTTQDLEGEVIETKEVKLPLNKEVILSTLKCFEGKIQQIPPMYSAIKVNGEELYKKARRGEEIERKARNIEIDGIELLSINQEKLMVKVDCSKGTYIRTLGNDIGDKLNTCGYVSILVRTKVGKFLLDNAKSIEDVELDDIISIKDALYFLPQLVLDGDYEKKALNGVKLDLKGYESKVLLLDSQEEVIAIYQKEEDGFFHCLRGFR